MNKQLMFMTACQAADFIGVDKDTFNRWVHGKDGPPRRLIGKRYYYQREYLTEWLQSAPRVLAKPGAVTASQTPPRLRSSSG